MSLCLLSVCLGACTSKAPLTREELFDHNSSTLEALESQMPAEESVWTLSGALLHALEKNADFRMAALQSAIASGDHKIANLALLPDLVARAGYTARNNDLASSSQSVLTGSESLTESTSTDRSRTTASLTLSWDITDFALALFRAREASSQYNIAEEQRRRVQQNLTADIVHAWWSAWAYQQLKPEMEKLREEINEALAQSDVIIQRRLQDPLRIIEYRKGLFYALKRLNDLSLDLEQLQQDLARLMNLSPEARLVLEGGEQLIELADSSRIPELPLNYWQLAALMNRPEVRISLYEGRIGISERRRAIWQMMPSIGLSYGTNYDSNSFLVNSRWEESGLNASLQILRLASYPAHRRSLKLRRELADMQNQAVATAVVSQVAISDKSYRQNQQSWCMSAQLVELDNQRTNLMEAQSAALRLDNLSLVRARLENLLLRTEVALDFASLQRDRVRLLMAVGLLDLPNMEHDEEVPDLARWLYRDIDDYLLAEMQTLIKEFELPDLPAPAEGEYQCDS
jgi:outer membrane protein TolC